VRTSRSFIFSFDTLRLSRGSSNGFRQSLLLGLLVVCAAEGVSRIVLAPIGRYWEYWDPPAAVRFEGYRRHIDSRKAPDIVIIGDSTAARDIDPAVVIASQNGRVTAYNLANPANFPLALKVDTLPLMESPNVVPKIIIASFAYRSFMDTDRVRRFENGILSSPYCQHVLGKTFAADYFYLLRLRKSSPFIVDRWHPVAELAEIRKHHGFLPFAGTERETRGDQSVAEAETSTTARLDSERLAIIGRLGQLAKARNFSLVVVVPPVRYPFPNRLFDSYLEELKRAQRELGFTVLNFYSAPFLSPENFYNDHHLNREGAEIYTREILKAITPILAGQQIGWFVGNR
jgi:hypothetical protein